MERKAKKVLDKLIKLPTHSCVWDEDYAGRITFPTLAKELRLSENELFRVFEYLEKLGYVKSFRNQTIAYELTHLGIHYKHFSREEIVTFIQRSILVPIGVTIVTDLLLHGAPAWWQPIQEWVLRILSTIF